MDIQTALNFIGRVMQRLDTFLLHIDEDVHNIILVEIIQINEFKDKTINSEPGFENRKNIIIIN